MRVSVKRRRDTCRWWTRVEKCGKKIADKKKMRIREKQMAKKNKERDKKVAGPFTYIQNVIPLVGTVTLNPVISFH